MNELQPVNQNVLLEIVDEKKEHKTISGIIIPDSALEKQAIGKVVAIGAVENAEIAVGDRVIYKEHVGTESEFEGRKYLFIPYAEILGKIVETDKI
jgi:chaperonin GroES